MTNGRHSVDQARAGKRPLRLAPPDVVAHSAHRATGDGDRDAAQLPAQVALALHDGPLQDVAALMGQVHYLRSLLEPALVGRERQRILDAIEDLGAGLSALDHGLRDIAWRARAVRLLDGTLVGALHETVRELREETTINAELDLDDDLEPLSAGIRSTLLLVVQEAVANVRAHSGARNVRMSIRRTTGQIVAEIADDGRGLDVDKEIASAARVGRLGVLGMYERVALLGGTFGISSRPGGPTVVSVVLATADDEPSLGDAQQEDVG